MPIIVTKEMAEFLAGRMEAELDWSDVYTAEERSYLYCIFAQAASISQYDIKHATECYVDDSRNHKEAKND